MNELKMQIKAPSSKWMFSLFGCLSLVLILQSNSAVSQSLYFPPNGVNQWDTLSPFTLGWCQDGIDSLNQFLDSNNTKAFILLKDGKIVLESYFGGFAQNDPWYWASAGKTITAFMTGIAQQEGYLDIHDTTSQYLGSGWTSCTQQQEEKITIRNQLTMTSGLDDGVADPYCTIDTCLTYESDAGTRWAYHNAPYTLLDGVINNATGVTLNSYTNQKLLNPTGMNGLFLPNGFNNVFYSTARSMARFGLLILNRGIWNGDTLMSDTTYFNEMTNTSQSLNKSYGYLWWLNGKPSFMLPTLQFVFNGPLNPAAPNDMFAALGRNGQMLNVVPSQGLVWLRMGDTPAAGDVSVLLNNQIWERINLLPCSTTGIAVNETIFSNASCHFDKFNNTIHIQSPSAIKQLLISDATGRVLTIAKPNESTFSITLPSINQGLVIVNIVDEKGVVSVFKEVVFD
ncbi:MAG: serine hydrolase domain-containing protein [Bacteroidota bacterium]